MSGTDIAGAYVGIYPDLSGFHERLAAGLKAALAGVDGEVPLQISGLQREVAKLRSELSTLGRTTATISLDTGSAQAKIAAIKTELLNIGRSVNLAKIGADALPFWAKIAELRTEFDAMSPLDVNVDANVDLALAKIAMLRGELASSSLHALMGSSLSRLAGAGGSDGGGTNWGGVLSSALWGGGGMLGMAGFGSLGSFAGFGPEHLIMTGVGLGGSMIGAGLGAGLLGLGAMGKFGVGMGTDMAGIGQAAGDIKTVYGDWMNLNTAIQQYGRNSLQASQAQLQLNQDLRSFSPVARQAVFTAAKTAYGWRSMFDKLTGPAERTGAQIINELIKRSEKFLPIVGKYAAQNTKIIQKDLQPLLNWTTSKGGGIGIFTELEKLFQKGLPTDMQTLTRALELFAKTIAYTAPMTGKFMEALDKFLGKYNSGAGLAKWEHEINKLVGDFRMWWDLVKILGKDVFQLFHNDAGTAKSIVQYLTEMLTKLHAWETSTQGKADLHNLFEVHKQEIMALLQLLPQLISVFGKIEFAVAPFATTVATDLVKGVDWLLKLNTLDVGKIIAFGAGIGIILNHMKLLSPLLHGLGKLPVIGDLLQKIPGIGKVFSVKTAGLDANTGALGANTDALIALTERMGIPGSSPGGSPPTGVPEAVPSAGSAAGVVGGAAAIAAAGAYGLYEAAGGAGFIRQAEHQKEAVYNAQAHQVQQVYTRYSAALAASNGAIYRQATQGVARMTSGAISTLSAAVPGAGRAGIRFADALGSPASQAVSSWQQAVNQIASLIGSTASEAARLLRTPSPGSSILLHSGIKHRAMGGPLMPGDTAVVGEKGPELLQMGHGGSAHVVPNHALRFLASGTLPPGSQLAPTSLARNQNKGYSGLTQAEQALLSQAQNLFGTLQSIAQSGLSPLQQLTQQLNATHERALRELVARLEATHKIQLVSMAHQIVAMNKAAEQALSQQLELNQLQALDQQTADIAQAFATMTSDISTRASDVAARAAQRITDASQMASDASAAKTKLIADQSQLWQDQYASRFDFGMAKQADMAKIALDKLTMKFDKEIAQAQHRVDLVTRTEDALVASAKVHLDAVQKRTDAAVAKAQKAYDATLALHGKGAAIAQAQAQHLLQVAQAEQQKEVAQANARLAAAQAAQSTLTAAAQAGLQSVQSTAALAEQRQQAIINKLQAEAPGSQGMQVTVNVDHMEDPYALGQEMMFELRLAGVA